MQNYQIQRHRKTTGLRSKWVDWLVYLPGAIIISYGIWLSITNF